MPEKWLSNFSKEKYYLQNKNSHKTNGVSAQKKLKSKKIDMKLFIIILMFLIQIKLNLSLKYQGFNCYVLSQSYEITIKLRG